MQSTNRKPTQAKTALCVTTSPIAHVPTPIDLGGNDDFGLAGQPKTTKVVKEVKDRKDRIAPGSVAAHIRKTKKKGKKTNRTGKDAKPVEAVEASGSKRKNVLVSTAKKAEPSAYTANNAISVAVTLKAERSVTMNNGSRAEVGGLRSITGERYVWVRVGSRIAITQYSLWHGSGGEASQSIRDQGVTIIGVMGAIRDAVGQLKKFPLVPLITRSGWSAYGFALGDGRVLVPAGEPEPLRILPPHVSFLARGGSLEGWRDQVAAPLAEHLYAAFFLMVMFAPALLRLTDRTDNFTFEMAGQAGRGKSTLQFIMASVAGPAIGAEGETYWRTCNATMNALETIMSQYNDMALILDEAALAPGGGNAEKRALYMRQLAFHLSLGRMKDRYGNLSGPVSRFICVLSTNRSIASMLGVAHAAEAEAIADRLMTIPLLDEREAGIFDRCPDGYETTGAFADALRTSVGEHFGHAMPAFLQYLVQARAEDEKRLRKRIASGIAKFTKAARVDMNDGSRARVAKAFGLVYVGGKLAERAGILPRGFPCMEAALACYVLHRTHGRASLSFEERLRAIASHPETIDIDELRASKLKGKKHTACQAFLYTGRSQNLELLIPVKMMRTLMPDWNDLRHDPEVLQRLRPGHKRNVVDRPVGPGGKLVPVYCFDITDL